MIILKAKTFGNNKNDKKETTEDAMRGFVGKLIEDYMRNEKKKERGRPSRKESKLNRLKARIQDADTEIEINKAEKELKNRKATLNKILSKDNLSDKLKSKLSDPKTKKNLKIAGLATLGTGLTAGAIVGGVKLKKKIDRKKKNEATKKQVADEE